MLKILLFEVSSLMQRRQVTAVAPKDRRAFIFRVESITFLRVPDLAELCCMEQRFVTVRKDIALDNELKQWEKGSTTRIVNRLLKTAAMLKVENVVPRSTYRANKPLFLTAMNYFCIKFMQGIYRCTVHFVVYLSNTPTNEHI